MQAPSLRRAASLPRARRPATQPPLAGVVAAPFWPLHAAGRPGSAAGAGSVSGLDYDALMELDANNAKRGVKAAVLARLPQVRHYCGRCGPN